MDEDHQTIISKWQISSLILEGAGHVWFIRDKNGDQAMDQVLYPFGEEYDHFMSRLIGE